MTAVLLEPPLTTSGTFGFRDHTALTHGPLLLRTRGMGRWHRPRSGSAWTSTCDGEAVTAYSLWCGQSVSSHRKTSNGGAPGFITVEALPDDGVPICGTCEGKAIGAGHPGVAATIHAPAGLLFEPRRLTPPKTCPGPQRGLYVAADDRGRLGRCLICGGLDVIRGRWSAGGCDATLTSHEPGPELVPGCPFHAWREMVRAGDGVRCGCRGGGR